MTTGVDAPIRIGVLALQGAVAEHAAVLGSLGAQAVPVRRPEQLENLHGLIVPGGESTAIARLAQPMGLLPAVRARMDAGMAVFGTCAGLILLSERLADVGGGTDPFAGLDRIGGLDVLARRNGYGRQRESFEAELMVEPGWAEAAEAEVDTEAPATRDPAEEEAPVRTSTEPAGTEQRSSLRAAFIRAPMIERLGAEVEVVARWDGRPVAVRQRNILAAAFHPELTGEDRMHRWFLQMAASG